MSYTDSNHYFLRGGGDMGELIRAKDWSKTALGDPAGWPQSLRTMVAVMLDNPFGMYIAWGEEFIQIYNEGYRPILGATKHPAALGISTRETFSEVWHIIGSMFEGVMKGKAVGFPDFMLPLNRNGYVEECYFDFSYSPIRKDNGEVGGILVTVIETTEKKRITEALKESNDQFRSTVRQAPVGITILRGPEYIVEMANDAYLELVDRKEAEFVGWPLFDSLPEVEETVHPLLDSVLYTGIPYRGNEVAIPVNRYGKQEISYFDFLYHPLKEDNGKISGIIVTVTEVSEKVAARKKIEESKRLYEAVTQNTLDLIYVFDLDYRFTYANEALLNMWGRTAEDAIGKGMLENGYEPWHAEMHEREIDAVIATKEPVRGEVGFPHATLGRRVYDYIFVPVIDHDGNVEAIAGSTRDITELVNSRKKIEESETRFRSLAESLPQLIWETDEKGNALYASGKWKDYTGVTPAGEAEWRAILHPDDFEENTKIWQNSLATGSQYRFDARIRGKEGVYRWHRVIGEPVFNNENKIVKWVGAFTDIQTEKAFTQELEKQVAERTQALEDTNMELEKMNKELQSFAYISSHDLQEPLRKIQTFSSQILNNELNNLSADGKDKFARMQNAAQRMQTLIDDLLTYSQTNTAERKFETVDLNIIIDEVKDDLKEELRHKHAVIEVRKTCVVHIIPFQFRQLLFNLVNNSLKFSKPGETPLIVMNCEMVKWTQGKNEQLLKDIDYCHISVSDNGIGFEEQYREKIFEVFQRLHGRSVYAGTGIGLAIVKRIVENHGGIVTATGELGRGATFDIYIPVI